MATTMASKVPIVCCACAAAKDTSATTKGARLPRGWKRSSGIYCQKCWHERYILRAVTIPVSGPVDGDWPALRAKLAQAWGLSTNASNWMTTELYARDVKREPAHTKIPAMPKVYLYPQTRARFPEMPSQVCSGLEQSVQAKYRAKRYAVVWTASESLPNYRYPVPFPVPAQAWSVEIAEQGTPIVSLVLPGGRCALKLRHGHEFWRQLKAVRQICDGTAIAGEAAIYRVTAHDSDGRNGEKDGVKITSRIMLKLVAWLPREATREAEGTLFIRTDSDSLLIGLDAERNRLWTLNADQARDWYYAHSRWLQRRADDSKAETRRPKRRRKRLLSDYEEHADKYHDRLKTFIQQTCAAIVGLAKRRGLAVVAFNDAITTFLPSFPYFALRTTLSNACDAAGLVFEYASGEVAKESPAPLAEDE